MKYILQKKYTDKEWSSFIHHPERENDWEDSLQKEAVEDSVTQFKTREDGDWFIKHWNESKHKPRGILLRIVER